MFRCGVCGAELDNDTVALNLRLRGNGIGSFLCGCCLGELLGYTIEEVQRLKEHFKEIGCTLFERSYLK